MKNASIRFILASILGLPFITTAEDIAKPYNGPRTERESVFEFTQPPACRYVGNDRYEITFAVEGFCDVTVGVLDNEGKVLRHLASGVLGKNAPAPFKKNNLSQTIYWDGKDDLGGYPKSPEKLQIRVMLGLKPVFDKWLGAKAPQNLPGRNLGVAIDASGVYVMTLGTRSKFYIRKFDRNGKYLQSLLPPSSKIPQSKLAGMGYVEYESGKRALHNAGLVETVADHAVFPVGGLGKYMADIQPAVTNGRIYFCTDGNHRASRIFYINTDATTDTAGLNGWPVTPGLKHHQSRYAASPDGKWIYMTGDGFPVVWRMPVNGTKAQRFLGNRKKPGKGAGEFNRALGLACDAQGRVYVCDNNNNRVQVFSAEGKHLKSIAISRPFLVCVHQKTGAIYVQHSMRVKGRSKYRVTKLTSFENPKEAGHVEGPFGVMALDSWSEKPRLWFIGGFIFQRSSGLSSEGNLHLNVWEESGGTFKKIMDFKEMGKKAEGKFYSGSPSGSALGMKVICNPLMEQVILRSRGIFDLKSGIPLGSYSFRRTTGSSSMGYPKYDDIAIDSKGYMHVHFNPGFYTPGVGRVDTTQGRVQGVHTKGNITTFPEVPYDYGVQKKAWVGIMPTRCQPGAKFFQDGIGVNMRGDVAVQSNIYYVPKMGEYAASIMHNGRESGYSSDRTGKMSYATFMRKVRERQKLGEKTYSIKRKPGVGLSGGTLWVFEWTGELALECAVNGGELINGAQIDELGALYFVTVRPSLVGEKSFLAGRGGRFGNAKGPNQNPHTGTLIKTRPGKTCTLIGASAPIPMDPLPNRKAELLTGPGKANSSRKNQLWVDEAEWLYAGASPITPKNCTCPTQRMHLDWYKRAFVPEQYRHSIGVLDTAGNLIMHLGRYGNYDDARAMKKGSEDIPMSVVRFISGTDTYLVFEDNGERVMVLKLDYHAEATVKIQAK